MRCSLLASLARLGRGAPSGAQGLSAHDVVLSALRLPDLRPAGQCPQRHAWPARELVAGVHWLLGVEGSEVRRKVKVAGGGMGVARSRQQRLASGRCGCDRR